PSSPHDLGEDVEVALVLDDVVHRAPAHGFHGEAFGAHAGHHDDRRPPAHDDGQEVEAAGGRQPVVEDHEVDLVDGGEGLVGVGGETDLEPGHLQAPLRQVPVVGIVVDYEDADARWCRDRHRIAPT